MFGVLKPPKVCGLPSDDRDAWRRSYCGGCKALGEQVSFGARFTLSYDQTFFALLIEGLQEHESPQGECRCPAAPWKTRPINDPHSPALKRAALFHMLLVDQWIYDQQLDQKGWLSALYKRLWGLGRAWSKSKVEVCLQDAQNSGVELSPKLLAQTMSLSLRQQELERAHERAPISPLEAAKPTSELLGLAFQELTLPVLPQEEQTEEIKESLDQLGRLVGSYVYLIDALQDLKDDLSRSRFNPCLIKQGEDWVISEGAVRQVSQELYVCYDELKSHLSKLPLWRYKSLLMSCVRVPHQGIFKRVEELPSKKDSGGGSTFHCSCCEDCCYEACCRPSGCCDCDCACDCGDCCSC